MAKFTFTPGRGTTVDGNSRVGWGAHGPAGPPGAPGTPGAQGPPGATTYAALTLSGTSTRAATSDQALDLSLSANATFSLTGSTLGTVVAMRVDPNGFTLTLPGAVTVTGSDPVTVTAWRMAEGWVYSVAGASVVDPPNPGDTVAPTAGTLAGSAIAADGFTLTVTGASDETELHAQPYSFSTDNGATYSAWQSSPVFVVTGKTASTAYQCKHIVRDNADPFHQTPGSAITVTTGATPGVLTYRGEEAAPLGSSAVTSFTRTAVPIGTADAARRVIVMATWHGSSARSDSAVTIGGITATRVYRSELTTARGFAIWVATVPTGSTADVVLTMSGTCWPSLAVWTANQQVTFVSGDFTNPAIAAGQTTGTISATAIVGGFALSGYRSGSAATSVTWTNLTERWDNNVSGPGSGGDMTTSTTTATVAVTWPSALTLATSLGIVTFKWGA